MSRSPPQEEEEPPPALDVAAAYDAHAEFVWQALHRMGVPAVDLPDLLQEVFVVVQRRRGDFEPQRAIRGWLWGIALGVARNHRWRARRRLELDRGGVDAREDADPERELALRQQRERGRRALAALDEEKRAVFVMFEVEGLSGREIAQLLDIPLGTVHSRLHAARRALADALCRDAPAPGANESEAPA